MYAEYKLFSALLFDKSCLKRKQHSDIDADVCRPENAFCCGRFPDLCDAGVFKPSSVFRVLSVSD